MNDSGLWLKDEIDDSILITKSKNISNNLLTDVVINEFSFDFKLKRTIQADKVNIEQKNWILYEPYIENISSNKYDILKLKLILIIIKIRNLFSNFRTMDLIQRQFKRLSKLGYSPDEIEIHL